MINSKRNSLFICLLALSSVNAKGKEYTKLSFHEITTIGGNAAYHCRSLSYADSIPGSKRKKNSHRWEILFDGSNTDKWRSIKSDSFPSSKWSIDHGTLSVANHDLGEEIITREQYSNFDFRFDFKLTNEANSGIKYFVQKIKNNNTGTIEWNGPEYQIIDDYNNVAVKNNQLPSGSTAALYLIYPPKNKKLSPAGKWNHARIVAIGNHVEHWLNGVKVVSYERGTPDFRQRMAATKFKNYENYGELPTGHIMITDHEGDKVFFRNMRIKRLM